MNNFGSKIKQLRAERSLTQSELANAVGVSIQAVSKWECGGTPDVSLLPVIANYFGISIDELFGNKHLDNMDIDTFLINLLQSIPKNDRMRRACELCWAIFKGISGMPNITNTPFTSTQNPSDNTCTRCFLTFESGISYFNARADEPSMFLLPEPDEGYDQILASSEEFINLFTTLSDPDFFETLLFLYKRKSIPFSMEHACSSLNINESKMREILSKLKRFGWAEEEAIELNAGKIAIFRPKLNNAFIAFLYFATEIIHNFKLWYMSHIDRENPLFRNKSKTKKNGKM